MAYVRCSKCAHGDWLRPGARYCAACAAPVSAPCEACGEAVLPGDRFCVFCARPVAASTAQGPVAGQAPAAAVEMPPEEVRHLKALAAAALERSVAAEQQPTLPTKAHLDQGDIDALFS